MKIALLGCTGSIGRTVLKIVEKYPDEFELVLLANRSQEDSLYDLANRFNVPTFFCGTGVLVKDHTETVFDASFLNRPETYADADVVVNAISGTYGVLPTFAALQAGKILALANKESVVCAGRLLRSTRGFGDLIRPIDSEHSTIWQCMGDVSNVNSLVLTCSGGSFRNLAKEELRTAKAADALRHPNWSMGKKVTIDCATLVNKGLEIIEAKRLFGIEDVRAVLHRESIVHSLVEMHDGTLVAGLSNPDMEIPIQYALTYPKRKPTGVKRLDLTAIGKLSFEPIDEERFPCLRLCKEISDCGDYAGTVLCAADDVCVDAYLRGAISFYGIYDVLCEALRKFGTSGSVSCADDVFGIGKEVKEYTLRYSKEKRC